MNLGNIANRPKNYINVRVYTRTKCKLEEMAVAEGLNFSDHLLKYYSTFSQQNNLHKGSCGSKFFSNSHTCSASVAPIAIHVTQLVLADVISVFGG